FGFPTGDLHPIYNTPMLGAHKSAEAIPRGWRLPGCLGSTLGRIRMKRTALFFTFLVFFSFSGCNWAEPPLPEPNADLDERLLGEWKSTGDREYHLEIARFKDQHYEVTLKGGSGYEETVSKWRGYHTDIDDLRVISLELLGWVRPKESKEMPEGRQHRWICL